jgi:DNA mismatch endonuclease (patch repair protein)
VPKYSQWRRNAITIRAHPPDPSLSPLPKFAPPTPERSKVMAAIRGRGNESTELAVARLLRANRVSGWRRHFPIPGTPDFAWPRQRVALFVDGCFWHGCPNCYVAPRRNRSFWAAKVERNRARDRAKTALLKREDWIVVRIWECRVSSPRTIARILRALSIQGAPSELDH